MQALRSVNANLKREVAQLKEKLAAGHKSREQTERLSELQNKTVVSVRRALG
jgi:cell shape-determining protein MreC